VSGEVDATVGAGCVFCAIGGGARPAAFVLDEPDVVAFLDASPLFKGHVLVTPRAHVPTFLDLPAAQMGLLFGAVQRVARAVEAGLGADGAFVALNNKVSQSVPHLHVHVVPRRKKDGLRGFFWPRARYADDAERDDYAARIRAALEPAQ
jgi:histidine triad (HIT) family protein